MYPLFNLTLKGQPGPARLYLHAKWRLIDVAKEKVECKRHSGMSAWQEQQRRITVQQ